jgi:hypothetical protein
MAEKEFSQSFSISGGQVGNIQLAQVGRDFMQAHNNIQGELLPPSEVIKLLSEIETLLKVSELPIGITEKTIRYLEAAKDEIQIKEPDKQFAANNLKRVVKNLEEASETTEKWAEVLSRIKPVVVKLASGLGVSASFFF